MVLNENLTPKNHIGSVKISKKGSYESNIAYCRNSLIDNLS